jgi:hypothetical protein
MLLMKKDVKIATLAYSTLGACILGRISKGQEKRAIAFGGLLQFLYGYLGSKTTRRG